MRLLFVLLTLFTFSQALFSAQEFGKVSYYSNKLQGCRMTNGERYDKRSYIAAHRKYPFGTILKVTNVSNGKFVIVRVTDRGPYHHTRIVDVSYAAAEKIGLIATGYANVKVEEAENLRFLLFPETLLQLKTYNDLEVPFSLPIVQKHKESLLTVNN